MIYKYYSDELYHHGIQGQKWGIRRYQNPDGSLTPAGRMRYEKLDSQIDKTYARNTAKAKGTLNDLTSGWKAQAKAKNKIDMETKLRDLRKKELQEGNDYYEHQLNRDIAIGAIVAGTVGGIAAGLGRKYLLGGDQGRRAEIVSQYKKQNKEINERAKEEKAYKKYESDVRKEMGKMSKGHDGEDFINDFNERDADNAIAARKAGKSAHDAARDIVDKKNRVYINNSYRTNKQDLLDKAKKNDSYQLDFLEAVQNAPQYNNKQWMQKEYSKYLDGPEEYWANQAGVDIHGNSTRKRKK